MMRFMRNNAVFVLVVVIFIVAVFIGTIFLVWGRGSMSSSSSERSVAAWVGTKEVAYADFIRAYDSRMEFYRRFYPGVSSAELERRFRVKKGALDSAIGRQLLLDEAPKLGLGVGDDEVARKVRETAAFQENGVFDPKKYREVLSSSGIKTALYEEDVRGELLAAKVRALVQEPAQVAEAEAFEEYRRDNEKVRLTLVALSPSPSSGGAITEQEARRAFDADPARYTRPERAQFAVSAILARDFPPPPPVGDAELKSYYEQNVTEFRTERSVRARHILFRLAEDAGGDEEKKIRERAEFVLGKARGGTEFAALAQEFSQDPSGPAGGDLGWFSAGQMVPAFEQAAFALGKGEVSDLVRTPFGYHIIKIEDIREAGTPPFEQIRETVVRKRAESAARAAVAIRVDEVNEALATGDLEAVAARFGMSLQTTALVPRSGPIPGPGSRPEVAESLFGLSEGDVSELVRQGEDYWVYKVVAKRAAAVPAFEEARADVESDLLAERARERSLGEARLRLEDLRRGEPLAKLAGRLNAELLSTALFTQRDFVTEAGVSGELFERAFAGAVGSFGGPVLSPGGKVLLYRVDERIPATQEGFAAEKEAVTSRLRSAKKDLIFEAWLEDLRRVRSVRVNEALVGKL